jgi:hypothetical protein
MKTKQKELERKATWRSNQGIKLWQELLDYQADEFLEQNP